MDDEDPDPAERLYSEGKRFDWKQDESPAAATVARSHFQQAAQMGHRGAARALAHMIYDGRGGNRDREQGLLILWSAFRRGDTQALQELCDLLATYGEEQRGPEAEGASELAADLDKVTHVLARLEDLMLELARKRPRVEGEQ